MRIPLSDNLESRDGLLTRDSLIINFSDEPDGIYKRPGTIQRYTGTVGTGQGIFQYGTHLYGWTSGNSPTSPSVLI